jgi:hypothetical protein
MARALSILRRAVSLPERDQWPAEGLLCALVVAHAKAAIGKALWRWQRRSYTNSTSFIWIWPSTACSCNGEPVPFDLKKRFRQVVSSSQSDIDIEQVRSV